MAIAHQAPQTSTMATQSAAGSVGAAMLIMLPPRVWLSGRAARSRRDRQSARCRQEVPDRFCMWLITDSHSVPFRCLRSRSVPNEPRPGQGQPAGRGGTRKPPPNCGACRAAGHGPADPYRGAVGQPAQPRPLAVRWRRAHVDRVRSPRPGEHGHHANPEPTQEDEPRPAVDVGGRRGRLAWLIGSAAVVAEVGAAVAFTVEVRRQVEELTGPFYLWAAGGIAALVALILSLASRPRGAGRRPAVIAMLITVAMALITLLMVG